MKIRFYVSGAAFALLLGGCALDKKQAVLPPVGPSPFTKVNHETDGYLIVYSAWSHFVDQGSTPHHSRYTITADDRTITQEIINHADRFDEGPLRLALSPGSYHVKARSSHFGRVSVPVIIEPHQTTFVYLDGSFHSNASTSQPGNAVRLPDGEIVGWSATVANK